MTTTICPSLHRHILDWLGSAAAGVDHKPVVVGSGEGQVHQYTGDENCQEGAHYIPRKDIRSGCCPD